MAQFYVEMFRFPFLFYQPSPATYVGATLVSLGAAVLGTLTAVRKAVALPPAEAMACNTGSNASLESAASHLNCTWR